jgi:hypothetical protein
MALEVHAVITMVRADDQDAFLNHSLKPRSMSHCGFIDPRNGKVCALTKLGFAADRIARRICVNSMQQQLKVPPQCIPRDNRTFLSWLLQDSSRGPTIPYHFSVRYLSACWPC